MQYSTKNQLYETLQINCLDKAKTNNKKKQKTGKKERTFHSSFLQYQKERTMKS